MSLSAGIGRSERCWLGCSEKPTLADSSNRLPEPPASLYSSSSLVIGQLIALGDRPYPMPGERTERPEKRRTHGTPLYGTWGLRCHGE